MKKCTKCKIQKPYSEFSRNKNKKDGLQCHCRSCVKLYQQENKEKISLKRQQYREKNKKSLREIAKNYRKILKQYYRDYNKNYYQENKKRINKQNAIWQKNRMKTHPLYKLKRLVKNRINASLKSNDYIKKQNSLEYLGCNANFYIKYLSSKFKKGMSWENHGEWHIDHIIPLSSANTEEELIKLFHYKNTQPLWAKENLKKGAKIL